MKNPQKLGVFASKLINIILNSDRKRKKKYFFSFHLIALILHYIDNAHLLIMY